MRRLVLVVALLSVGLMTAQDDLLVQGTIQGILQQNQGQVIQLAEAFSEDQYGWRPMADRME